MKSEDIINQKQQRLARNRKLLLRSFDEQLADLVQYSWTRAEQIGGDSHGPGIIANLKKILKDYV